jgi:hypothetical protein
MDPKTTWRKHWNQVFILDTITSSLSTNEFFKTAVRIFPGKDRAIYLEGY